MGALGGVNGQDHQHSNNPATQRKKNNLMDSQLAAGAARYAPHVFVSRSKAFPPPTVNSEAWEEATKQEQWRVVPHGRTGGHLVRYAGTVNNPHAYYRGSLAAPAGTTANTPVKTEMLAIQIVWSALPLSTSSPVDGS